MGVPDVGKAHGQECIDRGYRYLAPRKLRHLTCSKQGPPHGLARAKITRGAGQR